ncbi:MAG: ferritin-like domain-containing protein [Nitrospirae bacterium]|nr:ferritin-like domain-containing protein [Nitrospirota bacterium]MBI5696687.1 ferritin-like domain-containing protein [Nitrospirota bacterium]
MAKKEDLVVRRAAFEKNINKWIELEDLTVGSCDAIMKKSSSPVVKAMMKAIKMDSQKHKELLGVVLECLNGTITMTPEELGTISSLLEGHSKVEKDAIDMAEKTLADSRNFVISHIIKYILEDERKHFSMATDMNAFKAHIYPYA